MDSTRSYIIYVLVFALLFSMPSLRSTIQAQHQAEKVGVATTPPMGWNSYNCYGAAVTEAEVRANAAFMATHLKQYGWEYVVIDYCWFYPHPPNSIQNNPPQFRLAKDGAPVPWMPMDEYGRLHPDPRKFPSSAGGKGFKELADYIHSLGLKFGIHVMRGVPRQAVWANSPVKGGNGASATDIADTSSICPWLNLMYGVDMEAPGSQAYYNSLIELYESWGVDYIKLDDIDLKENYPYRASEAAAFRTAINQSERPIVLSLSLNMKWENREHVQQQGDLWRISKDFWDEWELLEAQFEKCALWAEMCGPQSWPDADMLQLGMISRRGPNGPERESRFTPAEEKTHMTLWCIAKSPLMMGGDMPANSDYVTSLLSNPEIIEVHQQGERPRQLLREDETVIWLSEAQKGTYYVAMFNLADEAQSVSLDFAQAGLPKKTNVRDLWQQTDLGIVKKSYSQTLPPHGATMLKVTPQ